uniref:Cyclin-dependent kinases regulatory subunit n=1 Tax=Theileria annulata TaxID=5874 RepID=A0A3B0MR52_THEAN
MVQKNMTLKKKKVDGNFMYQQPYFNYASKRVTHDPYKSTMCKDLPDHLNIEKKIDKIDNSIKPVNNSIINSKNSFLAGKNLINSKLSSKCLLKGLGNTFERNYHDFKKAPVKNPFSLYGLKLDTHKVNARRKTNSAPPLIDFDDPSEEYNLHSGENNRASHEISQFKPDVMQTDSNYSKSGLESESSYKKSSLETSRSFRTEYIDTSRQSKSDLVDTSRTYKSDSIHIDGIGPYKYGFESKGRIVIEYNPFNEVMDRLYSRTNNVLFVKSHKHFSTMGEGNLNPNYDTSTSRSRAAEAILKSNPSQIFQDLFERLESIVSSDSGDHIETDTIGYNNTHRDKRVDRGGSISRRSTTDQFSSFDVYIENFHTDSISFRNYQEGNNIKGAYSINQLHRNIGGGINDYEEIKLDITPNKYLSAADDTILKVSTDSAYRAMVKIKNDRKPLKPYDMNDDFMITDSEEYAVLNTAFGHIIYSPKFQDDKYMYRFMVLTSEAQRQVEKLSKTSPKNGFNVGLSAGGKRLLTYHEIVHTLGIKMSPGWHHFLYFKNVQKELILRKPL